MMDEETKVEVLYGDDIWKFASGHEVKDDKKSVEVEKEIILNPQWADYDWTDWAEYWHISLEQTRINFEKTDDEGKNIFISCNQTIQKQVAAKRQELAKQEADRVKYQEYLKQFAAEKKAKAVARSLCENTTSFKQQPRDKSEAKRHALYQEIMRQESGIDELKAITHQFTANNEDYMSDMKRLIDSACYTLETSSVNSRQAQRESQIYQTVFATLASRFESQHDVMIQSSNRTRRDIEDKIDNLSRERNNLPW
ncbi:MAG: hypothetical protein L0I48_01470 [Lactococcus plantarum]|nr:hypothetical protein [Lactococcus plantarum]MDN6085008.1 hypothetical protein [Lactococcus plantarum]